MLFMLCFVMYLYVLCDVTFYPSSFSDPNYPFMGSINNNNNNNRFDPETCIGSLCHAP